MVKVELQAHASLEFQVRDSRFTTTKEDLPKGIVELAGYPRIGDTVGHDDTGESWEVVRVYWGISSNTPIVVLR